MRPVARGFEIGGFVFDGMRIDLVVRRFVVFVVETELTDGASNLADLMVYVTLLGA